MINLSRKLTTGALAIAAASVAIGSFTGEAKAAPLTVSGGSFTNPLETTEITQTGTLNKFDPTLGTLTSAILTITGNAQQSFSGTNNAVTNITANLTSTTDLLITLPSGIVSVSSPVISLPSSSNFQTYAPDETKNFGPFTPTKTNTYNLTAADFGFLNGPGTFNLDAESFSGFTVSGGGGNIVTTQETLAAFGASIEYHYDPATPPPQGVPEPSAVLGLLGVVGVGALTRRRKS